MSSLTPKQFPGVLEAAVPTVTYEEKLDIGYRWYESKSITPSKESLVLIHLLMVCRSSSFDAE